MILLTEGGNAIPDSQPVAKADVAQVIDIAKRELPPGLLKNLHADIGSAGYKVESGDIDVMVEAEDVVAVFKTQDQKDPVKAAKQSLAQFFSAKNIQAVPNGRNVSIGVAYTVSATGEQSLAQVDVMVIHDVGIVAPYHQHGPRGSYEDPDFKGSPIFILMNSIGKHLGLKFDAFGAKLMKRDDNTVVARDRDAVAKVLLNPAASGNDLNSVKSIMAALANDPDRDAKLAQARDDEKKGLITLHESKVQPGSSVWFRQISGLFT